MTRIARSRPHLVPEIVAVAALTFVMALVFGFGSPRADAHTHAPRAALSR